MGHDQVQYASGRGTLDKQFKRNTRNKTGTGLDQPLGCGTLVERLECILATHERYDGKRPRFRDETCPPPQIINEMGVENLLCAGIETCFGWDPTVIRIKTCLKSRCCAILIPVLCDLLACRPNVDEACERACRSSIINKMGLELRYAGFETWFPPPSVLGSHQKTSISNRGFCFWHH